jgi:RNA polymerase sigma factor (sigma-70 family)
MAETTWALLRDLLTDRYTEFKVRLTRRLGSEELASESLHETWLRLNRSGHVGSIEHPSAYLLRIAVNIATDRFRAESSRARRSEIDALLGAGREPLDPAFELQARLDLQVVERAIRQLPDRPRVILIASRLEGLTHQAIAKRLGISRRTVLYELKRAVEYLDAQLDGKSADSALNPCAPNAPDPSQEA